MTKHFCIYLQYIRILIIFDTKILKKRPFFSPKCRHGGGKLLIHSELRSNISIIKDNTLSICSFTTNDNTDKLRGNQLPAALKENIPCRSRDIDSSGNNRSNECEIRILSKLSSNKDEH